MNGERGESVVREVFMLLPRVRRRLTAWRSFVRSFFVSLHRHVRGASLKLRTSAFATTLDGVKRGSFTSDSEP